MVSTRVLFPAMVLALDLAAQAPEPGTLKNGGGRPRPVNAPGATVEVVALAGTTRLSDLDEPLDHLLGIADTATQGVITHARLETRGYLRTGEVLETVPGLLVSQHSGEGKANQYYLRGFDLDHGSDLSSTVAGLPVNLPTHAHGQGYSDLSFLIPELVSDIQYQKGPYFAEEGDFSAAGAVHINYLRALASPLFQVEAGTFGYRRLLGAGSVKVGRGDLLAAVEGFRNDGPWTNPDDFRKFNGLLRYSWSDAADLIEASAMAYSGRWNSSDQVPQRAIDSGLIGRFGEIDPTDGGRSHRNSLVASWRHAGDNTVSRVEAYISDSFLDLFSNFTYFLVDPVNGDQFHQVDKRVVTGLRASGRWSGDWGGRRVEAEAGLQVRHDNIENVDLYHTRARQILSTVQEGRVLQTSEALYLQTKVQWSSAVRTSLGLRQDQFQFQVRSNDPANSGQVQDRITSPKASLAFGPWRETEYYLSYGEGFHSNDARGTTLTQVVDPSTHQPVHQDRVTPLVRAKGYEIGLRSAWVPGWQTTFALWRLDLGSELTFSGDEGTTAAGRPSRRQGVEWNNEVQLSSRLTLNADLAYSRARYADHDPLGDFVPQAIAGVGVVGLAWQAGAKIRLSLLDRYFGPRVLREDDRVRSRSSNLVQVQARWEATAHLTLTAEVFNLFNARAADIDYFYRSRLPGEPAQGLEDLHTHPVEPSTLRVGLRWRL